MVLVGEQEIALWGSYREGLWAVEIFQSGGAPESHLCVLELCTVANVNPTPSGSARRS